MTFELCVMLLVIAAISLADCVVLYQMKKMVACVLNTLIAKAEGPESYEAFSRKVEKLARLRPAVRAQLVVHYITIPALVFMVTGWWSAYLAVTVALSGSSIYDLLGKGCKDDPLVNPSAVGQHYAYLIISAVWMVASALEHFTQ